MTQKTESVIEPPEAAVVGENVPLENQYSEKQENMIQEAMAVMANSSKVYRQMKASERRERAIEQLQKMGVDL